MKTKKVATSVILGILVIIAILASSINIIIDYQWFKELGYLSVYFTKIMAVLKLTVPVFLVVFIGITIYYRSLIPNIRKIKKVIEIDKVKERRSFKVFLVINFIISMVFSIVFSSEYWYKILEYTSSTEFSLTDPIFNKDISFFVFKLPLIQSLYNSSISFMILLVVGTFVIYMILTAKDKMFSKNVQVDGRNIKNLTSGITSFAGKQLAVVAAFIMLLISLGYMISGWNLAYSPRGIVFGASYTDIAVSLKFFKVITIVALVGAFVVFFSIMAKKVKPIIISVVLIVILMIGENLAAGVVQKFIVQSNEKSLEKPYIEHNINYTKKAFNIDEIKEENFEIKNELSSENLKENEEIIDNIKVNSYRPALEFYNQFQYIRYYYKFNDIDIDRYNINGKYNQVFVAARELDFEKLDDNSITWQNKHLAYTHGYGVVMSKVNSVTSEGQPDFIMSNIPISNETNIPIENPRIYFGEGSNDYSIVNTKLGELDYPVGGENATNNYDGNAGIKMTFLNKLIFALKEQNPKFILSNDITSDSKIILHKNIMERVNKIAPFLRYDKDPYVVISDNRLYWIVDGYTTSDKFPFSQPMDGINYIRNSVKVVIDAYNGDTNFYVVDESDPIAMTYSKIFPELFKKSSELSEDLKAHFRYPEDLFTIQSNVLSKYHVSDPGVFYNGDDVWSIAEDKEKVEVEEKFNEADYVTMKLPNESKQEMVILEYFNTKGRDNMVAMYGARMDGENYGKMFLYEFPTGGTVYSPMLFKQKINQDPVISKELSLWDTKGSEVQFGDILIVPIENSLLYVEPLYLRASGEKSIPEMKNVIVGYGDKLVLAPNIETALKNIFNIKDESGSKPNTPGQPVVTGDMNKIKEIYSKAIEAQKNGDWAKYGEYITELGNLINSLSQ
ncbi:UPF0182 family protein [Clostridium sp. UBA4548]|uniref:UPF0182 family protein n=1 Tax=Clostridium sp. UBA4548 TaxID=1946361 RepID=UPI0025C15E0D|nr:UPF0182 family protein [Clostridium sp. UBA4548]